MPQAQMILRTMIVIRHMSSILHELHKTNRVTPKRIRYRLANAGTINHVAQLLGNCTLLGRIGACVQVFAEVCTANKSRD